MDGLRIRPMRPDEISIAVNWAAAEGWNPGLADDACFAAADPEGFFIGELEGSGRDRLLRQLGCEFHLPRFPHRARGFARARYGLAYGMRPSRTPAHA